MSISLLDDVSISLFEQSFVEQLACHVGQPVGCYVDQCV